VMLPLRAPPQIATSESSSTDCCCLSELLPDGGTWRSRKTSPELIAVGHERWPRLLGHAPHRDLLQGTPVPSIPVPHPTSLPRFVKHLVELRRSLFPSSCRALCSQARIEDRLQRYKAHMLAKARPRRPRNCSTRVLVRILELLGESLPCLFRRISFIILICNSGFKAFGNAMTTMDD
jgi:hypothetical protein